MNRHRFGPWWKTRVRLLFVKRIRLSCTIIRYTSRGLTLYHQRVAGQMVILLLRALAGWVQPEIITVMQWCPAQSCILGSDGNNSAPVSSAFDQWADPTTEWISPFLRPDQYRAGTLNQKCSQRHCCKVWFFRKMGDPNHNLLCVFPAWLTKCAREIFCSETLQQYRRNAR